MSGRRADNDRRQSRCTAMRDFALRGMLPAKQAARGRVLALFSRHFIVRCNMPE